MSTDYVLPSRSDILISDIWALWRSGMSARVPECQKLKCRLDTDGVEHLKMQPSDAAAL